MPLKVQVDCPSISADHLVPHQEADELVMEITVSCKVPPRKNPFKANSDLALTPSHFYGGDCFLDGLGLSSILE